MTDEEHRGVVNSLVTLGQSALASVPAGFLILCGLNVIFIIGLLWFLNNQGDARERIIAQIMSSCLQQRNN
jgi:hypothetical protein